MTVRELSEVYDETISGSPRVSSRVHVSDLDPESARLIRNTEAQLPLLTPPVPHSSDPSLAGRASLIPAAVAELEGELKALEAIEAELTGPNPPEIHFPTFPHPAFDAVKAGLAKEALTNSQLNEHIDNAKKHQKQIDLLLDISAELTAMKDGSNEMPEKLKSLLADLKDEGIDIWKSEEKTLSREKISDLKSLSSAQVDKLRSNLQILFTTKIQVLIQSIGAILECVKDMVRNHTKLISTINGNTVRH